MKSSKKILILFLIVAVFQLIVPFKMIYDKEDIIKTGKAYKFLTQPIDPNDPFRGKFIRLNYEMDSYRTQDTVWQRKQIAYLYLKDSLGFAKVDFLSKEKLKGQNDYIEINIKRFNKRSKIVHFNLPFDRFYMEESKAKPAENLFNRNQRGALNENITYALVYVKKGDFVLKDVLINDIPIKDLVVLEDK